MIRNVCIVTNIPTPYRNYCFELLHKSFAAQGIAFHVIYMAWTEPDRSWSITAQNLGYSAKVHRGLHPRIFGAQMHINPAIAADLLLKRYDVVIIGGYYTPSHWIAMVAAGLSGSVRLLWFESNINSELYKGGIPRRLKRFFLNRMNGFMIPGEEARRHLMSIIPTVDKKPLFTFPNLVDCRLFIDRVDEARNRRASIRRDMSVNDNMQLWLCSARLEEIKGLQLLIPLLSNIDGIKLVVAGEGSQLSNWTSLANKCRANVVFVGHLDIDEYIPLLASADIFVLPSLRDPSPLAPIEALAAGLPLFVSSRIGNFSEVLWAGENGWRFEIGDDALNRKAIREIGRASSAELTRKGRKSREIFTKSFDAEAIVSSFITKVRAAYEG